uniref:U4/U6.U5 small nuclear ribonucleoprotein 27 kDa protein n=1 Tax=Panagrolaimus superbus TaxID=310955 RepID=A0A914ZA83_9BILA
MARDRSHSPRERDERPSRRRSKSPNRRRERSPVESSSHDVRKRDHDTRKRSRSRSPRDRRHAEKERDARRSRSPKHDRREYEKDRGRDYDKDRDRLKKVKHRPSPPKIDLESLSNAEDDMMKMMGFGGFETTKNKKVEGNMDGIAKVNKPRKFRQYMNRKGGFNRPLDYIA